MDVYGRGWYVCMYVYKLCMDGWIHTQEHVMYVCMYISYACMDIHRWWCVCKRVHTCYPCTHTQLYTSILRCVLFYYDISYFDILLWYYHILIIDVCHYIMIHQVSMITEIHQMMWYVRDDVICKRWCDM